MISISGLKDSLRKSEAKCYDLWENVYSRKHSKRTDLETRNRNQERKTCYLNRVSNIKSPWNHQSIWRISKKIKIGLVVIYSKRHVCFSFASYISEAKLNFFSLR